MRTFNRSRCMALRTNQDTIVNFEPAFACDDYLVQCKAAELGLGVIFLPRVQHRYALDRGLVHLP